MWCGSARLQQRWVRILPHIVDTTLLISAITLTILIQQYPIQNAWLSAKLIALIFYILCGTIALKRGKTPRQRKTAFVLALVTVFYILAVAQSHSPWPW
jgi:uncharacterized membrane protein SirB2